ncbi:hypothetical protein HDU89_008131 [Geranomyces variabilis]|nr:hypothetical protein HDU89_008131 [Geranomyces variabilis]
MNDSPVNKANAFANAAEEYAERGQLGNAMEAHFRAAEQFLSAVSYTSDPEATRTLKLLYSNHTRQGKDLQRRLQTRSPSSSPLLPMHSAAQQPVQQQRSHGKPPTGAAGPIQQAAKTPVSVSGGLDSRRSSASSTHSPLVQRSQSQATDHRYRQQAGGTHLLPPQMLHHNHVQRAEEKSDFGSRNYFVGQSQTGSALAESMFDGDIPAYGGGGNVLNHMSPGPATMAVTSLDESTRSLAPNNPLDSIADSSYSVVAKAPEEDPEDPFNKFWEAVENLVDKITGPVAFATAPIGNSPQVSEPPPKHASGDPAERSHANLNASLRSTQMLNSYLVVNPNASYSGNAHAGPSYSAMGSTANAYGRPVFYNGGVVVSENDGPGVVGSIESNYFGQAPGGLLRKDFEGGGGRRPGARNSFSGFDSSAGALHDAAGMSQQRLPLPTSKTNEELIMENHHLKQTLNALTHRMALLERTTEENNLLRSSIIQFRQDVKKQVSRGRRGMGVSMISGRDGGRESGRERERELEAKVAKLEQELLAVRDEGQRMTTAMNKYKERWDRLKESAKRKKEAASTSGGTGPPPEESVKPVRPSPSPSPSLQQLYGSTPPSDVSHPPSPPPTTHETSPGSGGGFDEAHQQHLAQRRDSGAAAPRGHGMKPVRSTSSVTLTADARAPTPPRSTPAPPPPIAIPVATTTPTASSGHANEATKHPVEEQRPPSSTASSASAARGLARSGVSFSGDRSLFYSATSGSGFE